MALYVSLEGEEQDITEMMLFLTSSKARFIAGETFRVSWGFTTQI